MFMLSHIKLASRDPRALELAALGVAPRLAAILLATCHNK